MAKDSPFGKSARKKGLSRYFDGRPVPGPDSAWEDVYRLLLSVDRRTRLAHVYDSNHMQDGGNFHSRAVKFTDLLCSRWGIEQDQLNEHIDYLFKFCLEGFPRPVASVLEKVRAEAPDDDDDPEADAARSQFIAEVVELLMSRLGQPESRELIQLVQEIEQSAEYHFTIEKKRANVRGEGFEDTLEWLFERVAKVPRNQIFVRRKANDIPGFKRELPSGEGRRDKIPRPDLVLVSPDQALTLWLVTVKWSLRQDRLDTFGQEYAYYRANQVQGAGVDYVLVTNEMDIARLRDVLSPPPGAGGFHFNRVYHVNASLLESIQEERFEPLRVYRKERRLLSLEDLLRDLEVLPR